MPAKKQKAPVAPTDAEIRAFGDLAEDIAYLRRGCHLTVAPFHGEFRVGDGASVEVLTADQVNARALKERGRREARGRR